LRFTVEKLTICRRVKVDYNTSKGFHFASRFSHSVAQAKFFESLETHLESAAQFSLEVRRTPVRYVSTLLISLFILTSAAQSQELTSAYEYSQRGIARFEKNDLDGAIADFTKVIEMNGKDREFCYYFRGMAHYRKGNPNQAIDDLSKAIAIKPDPRFFDDRGNLFAREGELDRAIVDLNKAIEIAPQYAKAYGDRGLVRLMRGEGTDAELDFRKCFELDSRLEPQFKVAANQVKQRAVSRYLHEKPSDVEITKFSWTESPSRALIAPSSAPIAVTTSPVSPTGTRVLADPNAKGEPGPGEILNPSGITAPSPRTPTENTRDFIAYKFTISIRNTGSGTIVGVKWAYFFEPKDAAREGLVYLFMTKTNISPGKEKTLNDSIPSSTGPGVPAKLPSKHNQALFNERVAILRLDYADGSSWKSAADVGAEKTSPPH
jgi:tetratricopeptide (TPR) repeat protein